MQSTLVLVGRLVVMTQILVPVAYAIDMSPDPVGRWRFKHDDKVVKVVTIGGSTAAAPVNFGTFLGAACEHVEIKNKARIGYGAQALHGRFKRQVIRNRRVDLTDSRFEYWLLYNGGMNSVGYPEGTIDAMSRTFALAHKHNMKVFAMSLTPWGSSRDSKWRGIKGLQRHDKTRKVVDFAVGKLSRLIALGSRAGDRADWRKEELSDVSVNLFDGVMRYTDAPLRDRERLLRRLTRTQALRNKYPDSNKAADRAAAVPRWFMRPELRAHDHIHPNLKGQKLMALQTCQKAPASWGCDCSALQQMQWKRGKGLIRVQSTQ